MPTITITDGPSNRSLSGTNNQDEEIFTLDIDPNDLVETGGGAEETLRVRYEFSGTTLWDNVSQRGEIDSIWYPIFNYRGFCKVGTFNLQLHIHNMETKQDIASSNVWTWSVTA